MSNRREGRGPDGFVLIALSLVLVTLIVLSGALVAHAVAELQSAQRSQASLQAMYLAEAGIDQAIVQLRSDYNWVTGYAAVPLGATGTYSVTVQPVGTTRRVTAQGSSSVLGGTALRSVEAMVRQSIPPNFYDNAAWVSQNLDLKGNAYQIVGDLRHGDTTPSGTSGVTGTATYDPATNPLPRLSFQQLYNIAQAQGNVYDAARLQGGPGVFPTSFWHTPPTDPNDPTTGVPNVNYVTTDLVLNGNIGTIGGFFVVVGNVLTDPAAVEDTTISGNGQVAGAIYTTGNFRINGGGGGINVTGGVWAGDEMRVNGNATVAYNATYMNAIRGLNITADVQVISWQDLS